MKKYFEKRIVLATGLILLAAASRLVPHPYNFSPIDGLALFSGAAFGSNRLMGFLIPMVALFLGDLVLGFHSTLPYVYGTVALMVVMGRWLGMAPSVKALLGCSISGSILFFVVTNFGMWMTSSMYSPDTKGLVECYIAGLPFFHWTLLGDLVFSVTLFGAFARIEKFAFAR